MIVKMKKLTLLCLAESRLETLEALAGLGAVQVEAHTLAESGDRPKVGAELARTERVMSAIKSFTPPDNVTTYAASGGMLVNELEAKVNAYSENTKNLDVLYRHKESVAPWGDFDPSQIAHMAVKGIHVYLCISSREEMRNLELPDDAVVEVLAYERGQLRYVVITREPFEGRLPLAHLPEEMSLGEIDARIDELRVERNELSAGLSNAHGALGKLKRYYDKLKEEYDFLAARDSMQDFGEITVLTGYIPGRDVPRLEEAAIKHGWGLQVTEPAEGEIPPVLLDLPKWLNPIRPLLEFLGILPGYREIDVSLPMMFFMSIFFAMIVNDAGYCLIYLVASALCLFIFRKKPKGRQVAALFLLFSIFGTVWGILAGSWFGYTLGGLHYLTDEATKNGNIKFGWFTLAVIHMSIGHLLQLFKELRFRNILAQVGWLLVLAGFYIVAVKVVAYPGDMPPISGYLIAAGVVLLLAFNVRWNDIGSVFNFPFDIINCFTDTLSYIRLFAVGMAGGYMAASFNMMSENIMRSAYWAIPLGIALILVAHLLNMALGMISVLVHGVRLNTLEFSNHTGLTWSGNEFKPLKKS